MDTFEHVGGYIIHTSIFSLLDKQTFIYSKTHLITSIFKTISAHYTNRLYKIILHGTPIAKQTLNELFLSISIRKGESPFSSCLTTFKQPSLILNIKRHKGANMKSINQYKNKLLLRSVLISAMIVCLLAGPIYTSEARAIKTPMIPADFSSLAEASSPSIVNISTVKIINGGGRVFRHFSQKPFGNDEFFNRFFGSQPQREYKQKSLGSGFIVDKDGYIVTNNHVVENTDEIRVILQDGKEYDAEIVGRDKNTDLALIKITPETKLPALELGDSDKLKVGKWVVAIGNPFGLGHTVTAGIVSAKGRVIGSGPYDDFIQTDTSINPGNSGGPLLDLEGNVVGINTAIIQNGQGIGFAIPSNLAKGIIEQLKTRGNVTRGWIGVSIQEISNELSEYYKLGDKQGVLIVEAFDGDPAEKAGIRTNDIIIEIDGKRVINSRGLTGIIANKSVGSKVKVKVLRDGKTKTFKVMVAKRKDKHMIDNNGVDNELGLKISELTPELTRKYKVKRSGVIITEVQKESKAHKAGLVAGDIISEINHQRIKDKEDYLNVVNKLDKGQNIVMVIVRKGYFVKIVKITK